MNKKSFLNVQKSMSMDDKDLDVLREVSDEIFYDFSEHILKISIFKHNLKSYSKLNSVDIVLIKIQFQIWTYHKYQTTLSTFIKIKGRSKK